MEVLAPQPGCLDQHCTLGSPVRSISLCQHQLKEEAYIISDSIHADIQTVLFVQTWIGEVGNQGGRQSSRRAHCLYVMHGQHENDLTSC